MHLKEDSFQVCCCQHHVLFYLIRQALWHLWEEWLPFEKLPAVGSGFEHLPVPSGLEEPDRHKVAACSCNWREPVFSGGSRWWRCRSRWSRRLPPRRGRAGTWRYFRTFSSSTSLPEDSSISQSEIDIGVWWAKHRWFWISCDWPSYPSTEHKHIVLNFCEKRHIHQVALDRLQLLSLLERTCRTHSSKMTAHFATR